MKKQLSAVSFIAVISILITSFVRVNAAPGDLDTTFDADGFVVHKFNQSEETAAACLVQPDGKLLVIGTVTQDNTTGFDTDIEVRRYTINQFNIHELDTTFGNGGILFFSIGSSYDRAFGAALQADGKIVITGDYWTGTNWDIFVLRLNSNGFADQTFGTFGSNGRVTTAVSSTTDGATSVAVQSDGKIVVAGYTANAGYDAMVLRYNSNGTLDTGFDGDGKAFASFTTSAERFNSVAIQSNGKIVAGGYAFITGSGREFSVARFNTNGSLDTTFSADGKAIASLSTSSDDEANAVRIQSDGKIVLAGSAANLNTFALARFSSTGSLDTTFDTDGKLTTNFTTDLDAARDLVIQSDGKLVAFGFMTTNGIRKVAAARYNSNGGLDSSFGTSGKALNLYDGEARSARPMANGYFFTANSAEFGENKDMTSLIVAPNGTQKSGEGSNVSRSNTNGSALQADGRIVLAGSFNYWNNSKCVLMRLNVNGSVDTTLDGDGRVATNFTGLASTECEANDVKIQSDGKIVMAGQLGTYGFVARFNSDGSLDTSFGGGFVYAYNNESLEKIAIDAGGNIVAISSYDQTQRHAFRFQPSGTLDPSFDADGVRDIAFGDAIELQTDGKILIAGSGNQSSSLMRLNSDGSNDLTFSSDGLVTEPFFPLAMFPTSLAVQADGKVIIASTGYNIGGGISGPYNNLIRYNTNGSRDTGFGSGGTGAAAPFSIGPNGFIGPYIHGVAIQSDGRIVTGSAMNPGNPPQYALNRFSATGIADASWGSNGLRTYNSEVDNSLLVTMELDSSNRIVSAGNVSNGFVGVACFTPN